MKSPEQYIFLKRARYVELLRWGVVAATMVVGTWNNGGLMAVEAAAGVFAIEGPAG